jgi:hypothetical protein
MTVVFSALSLLILGVGMLAGGLAAIGWWVSILSATGTYFVSLVTREERRWIATGSLLLAYGPIVVFAMFFR